ncbi:hypothetical protein F0L68_36625 [Solihabitans fulvus]|uniref:Uncharacterized protein n=1 Tax=Solihabitans fulvus TaxID=1892852 RepID=A0A5B2WNA7_9PSEU|nr:hypothetical protein F0L68_36625 [Solihabitans fulvus]
MATKSAQPRAAPTSRPDTASAREERRVVAPYITAWSAEQDLPFTLVERPDCGISYVDELPTDRDSHGVLWRRAAVRHQIGRPEFGKVHPLRQRRAMRRLLCQVCAEPAGRSDDGVLWLLRDYRHDWPGWPEGMASVEPPICVPCVAVSLRLCPALRHGAVAVRAREHPIAGVRGALYRKGVLAPVAVEAANLPYDAPGIHRMVASALIRELRGCSLVSTGELVEEHEATGGDGI